MRLFFIVGLLFGLFPGLFDFSGKVFLLDDLDFGALLHLLGGRNLDDVAGDDLFGSAGLAGLTTVGAGSGVGAGGVGSVGRAGRMGVVVSAPLASSAFSSSIISARVLYMASKV